MPNDETNDMEWRPLVPELVVSDFAKSLRFYVSVLGFSIKFRRANPLFAYLEFEGSQIVIEELEADSWLVGELAHPRGRSPETEVIQPVSQSFASSTMRTRRRLSCGSVSDSSWSQTRMATCSGSV